MLSELEVLDIVMSMKEPNKFLECNILPQAEKSLGVRTLVLVFLNIMDRSLYIINTKLILMS